MPLHTVLVVQQRRRRLGMTPAAPAWRAFLAVWILSAGFGCLAQGGTLIVPTGTTTYQEQSLGENGIAGTFDHHAGTDGGKGALRTEDNATGIFSRGATLGGLGGHGHDNSLFALFFPGGSGGRGGDGDIVNTITGSLLFQGHLTLGGYGGSGGKGAAVLRGFGMDKGAKGGDAGVGGNGTADNHGKISVVGSTMLGGHGGLGGDAGDRDIFIFDGETGGTGGIGGAGMFTNRAGADASFTGQLRIGGTGGTGGRGGSIYGVDFHGEWNGFFLDFKGAPRTEAGTGGTGGMGGLGQWTGSGKTVIGDISSPTTISVGGDGGTGGKGGDAYGVNVILNFANILWGSWSRVFDISTANIGKGGAGGNGGSGIWRNDAANETLYGNLSIGGRGGDGGDGGDTLFTMVTLDNGGGNGGNGGRGELNIANLGNMTVNGRVQIGGDGGDSGQMGHAVMINPIVKGLSHNVSGKAGDGGDGALDARTGGTALFHDRVQIGGNAGKTAARRDKGVFMIGEDAARGGNGTLFGGGRMIFDGAVKIGGDANAAMLKFVGDKFEKNDLHHQIDVVVGSSASGGNGTLDNQANGELTFRNQLAIGGLGGNGAGGRDGYLYPNGTMILDGIDVVIGAVLTTLLAEVPGIDIYEAFSELLSVVSAFYDIASLNWLTLIKPTEGGFGGTGGDGTLTGGGFMTFENSVRIGGNGGVGGAGGNGIDSILMFTDKAGGRGGRGGIGVLTGGDNGLMHFRKDVHVGGDGGRGGLGGYSLIGQTFVTDGTGGNGGAGTITGRAGGAMTFDGETRVGGKGADSAYRQGDTARIERVSSGGDGGKGVLVADGDMIFNKALHIGGDGGESYASGIDYLAAWKHTGGAGGDGTITLNGGVLALNSMVYVGGRGARGPDGGDGGYGTVTLNGGVLRLGDRAVMYIGGEGGKSKGIGHITHKDGKHGTGVMTIKGGATLEMGDLSMLNAHTNLTVEKGGVIHTTGRSTFIFTTVAMFDGGTLSFDLGKTPNLTISGTVLHHSPIGFDITSLAPHDGHYIVATIYSTGLKFNQMTFNGIKLTDLAGTRLGGRLHGEALTIGKTTQLFVDQYNVGNGLTIWTGAAGPKNGFHNWDLFDKNWDTGAIDNNTSRQFLHGDAVLFEGAGVQGPIAIAENGVILAPRDGNPGMEVRGGDWSFSGGEIKGGGILLSGDVKSSLKFSDPVRVLEQGISVTNTAGSAIRAESGKTLTLSGGIDIRANGDLTLEAEDGATFNILEKKITLRANADLQILGGDGAAGGVTVSQLGDGAIRLDDKTARVNIDGNVRIGGNSSTFDGGAVDGRGRVELGRLDKDGATVFADNSAAAAGGALSVGNFAISGGTNVFTGNQAFDRGGAVYASAIEITAGSNLFSGNDAGIGGALYSHEVAITGGTSSFTGNDAEYGGAIFADCLLIKPKAGSGVSFEGNSGGAVSFQTSAAIAAVDGAEVIIQNNIRNGSAAGIVGPESGGDKYLSLAAQKGGTLALLDPVLIAASGTRSAVHINMPGLADPGRFTAGIAGKLGDPGDVYDGTVLLDTHVSRIAGDVIAHAGTLQLANGAGLAVDIDRNRFDFLLKSGATLTTDANRNVLSANLSLEKDSVLEFDLLEADGDSVNLLLSSEADIAAAAIGGGTINLLNAGGIDADLLKDGIVLVDARQAGAVSISGKIQVNGVQQKMPSRTGADLVYVLATDDNRQKLLLKGVELNGVNTSLVWNTGSGVWDIDTTRSWHGLVDGVDVYTFLNGDDVEFLSAMDDGTVVEILPAGGVKPNNMLVKNPGLWTFTGQEITVANDLEIEQATVIIDEHITVGGKTTLGDGSALGIAVNRMEPLALKTQELVIGDGVTLDVTNYNPLGGNYRIIESSTAIVGDFERTTIAGREINDTISLDHFLHGAQILRVTDLAYSISGGGFVWKNPDSDHAHGTFAVDSRFTLPIALSDNAAVDPSTNAFGWDGKTLTKTGAGELVLTEQNDYTGATIIREGTLTLKYVNSLSGTSGVDIAKGAVLALDYSEFITGAFTRPVAGEGILEIRSDAIIVDDNSGFTGTAWIRDGATLDMRNAGAVGTAAIVLPGRLETKFGGALNNPLLGRGQLVVATGELTIARENPRFNGETLIQSSLTLRDPNAVGHSVITLDTNAKLTLDLDGDFNNDIRGGGAAASVVVAGDANATLRSAGSDYTGTTSILAGGVLTLAHAASAGKSVINISSDISGEATLNADFNGALVNSLEGSGNLVIQKNILIRGENDFHGLTTLADGASLTLLDAGGVKGDVQNDGRLIIANQSDGSFAGEISGSGNFFKEGAGELTVVGTLGNSRVRVGSGALVANLASGADLQFKNDATFRAGSADQDIARLSGVGSYDGAGKNLTLAEAAFSAGSIENVNTFTVADATGDVEIGSLTNTALLDLADGALHILDKASVGGAQISGGTRLTLTADSLSPALTVGGEIVIADGAELNIVGDLPGVGNRLVLIEAGASIANGFSLYTVGGRRYDPTADPTKHFVYGLEVGIDSTDDTRITVTGGGLAWYNPQTGMAHGAFDVATLFQLDRFLEDNTNRASRHGDWDGATLDKHGSGILILAAENAYTGGTVVHAGTVRMTNPLSVGVGPVSLASAGVIDLAYDGGFINQLSGAGALLVNGDIALDNANAAFSGQTVVLGALGLNQRLAVGTSSVQVSKDGALTLGFGGIFQNALSGNGSLVVDSHIGITRANAEFLGDTTINPQKSLTIADANAVGGGAIVDDGHLLLAFAGDGLLSNAISGTGQITKLGAGAVTLTGALSHTGATSVRGGRLIADLPVDADLNIAEGAVFQARTGEQILYSLTGAGIYDGDNRDLRVAKGDFQAGDLTDVGAFVKAGNGTFAAHGIEAASIQLADGALAILAQAQTDLFEIYDATTLQLVADRSAPAVDAGKFDIVGTGAVLDVSGYSPDPTGEALVLIQSGQSIAVEFSHYTIGGRQYNPDADPTQHFIHGANIGRNALDDTQIVIRGGTLAWYDELAGRAHGTFNIASQYALSRELANNTNTDSWFGGWTGDTLTKTGPGTLILAADNSYTGPTIVKDGLLKITRAANVGGTSRIDVDDDGRFEMAFADDETFAKEFIGSGRLSFSGPAATTLTADSTGFTGLALVESGGLRLSGEAVLGGDVEVWSGARLFGTGAVGGQARILSGASVSPGAGEEGVTSALAVGQVLFENGSFFDVRVNPFDQTDADVLNVGGVAKLDGATVRHIGFSAAPSAYPAEGEWTILTAGTLSGAFADDVDTSLLPFLSGELIHDYDENVVRLRLNRTEDFLNYARTRNQRSVARALDYLALDPQNPVYLAMVGIWGDGDTVRNAYDHLSGEIHASLRGAARNSDRLFGERVMRRLSDRMFNLDHRLGRERETDGFWLEAERGKSSTDRTFNTGAAKLTGWSAALGGDRKIGDWVLGAALQYRDGDYAVTRRSSTADIASGNFMAYAGRSLGSAWRLRLGAGYGLHEAKTRRRVPFMAETLNADYRLHSLHSYAEAGYSATNGVLSAEPYAGASWTMTRSNAFREKGGDAALRAAGETTANPAFTLGLRTRYRPGKKFAVEADIGWRHMFGPKNPEAVFAFVGGRSFTIEGAPMARNSLLLRAAFEVELRENIHLRGGYGGGFSEAGMNHAASLELNFSF